MKGISKKLSISKVSQIWFLEAAHLVRAVKELLPSTVHG